MTDLVKAKEKLAEGKQAEKAGDWDGAQTAYSQALDLRGDADDAEFDWELAQSFKRIEDHGNAELARVTREGTAELIRMGEEMAREGNAQQARQAFDKAIELSSDVPDVHLEVLQRIQAIVEGFIAEGEAARQHAAPEHEPAHKPAKQKPAKKKPVKAAAKKPVKAAAKKPAKAAAKKPVKAAAKKPAKAAAAKKKPAPAKKKPAPAKKPAAKKKPARKR